MHHLNSLGSTGTYILCLKLSSLTDITIGNLGRFNFEEGWYAYVGSAFGPGGLKARLRHHLYNRAKPRWHIDYLKVHIQMMHVWFSTDPQRLECIWARQLAKLEVSGQPVPGFGSSDCHCPTHLFHFNKMLPPAGFLHHLRKLNFHGKPSSD
ncbi:MAG: DUF123 domain-containing protein [Gammaproteobacteria bacterium]